VIRTSSREDVIEDAYLAVRELIETFGVAPREIRRVVNLAIAGTPPASIRDRVTPVLDSEAVQPLVERPENGPGAAEGGGLVVGTPETREGP
jgi:hypothetical protein